MRDIGDKVLAHRLHPAKLAGHFVDAFNNTAELPVTPVVLQLHLEIPLGNLPDRCNNLEIKGPFVSSQMSDQCRDGGEQEQNEKLEQHGQQLEPVGRKGPVKMLLEQL
ncbi:hypothetical protein D3C74_363760 [compost metagenome]